MALLPYNYAQGQGEDEEQQSPQQAANSLSQSTTSAGPAPYQAPQTSSSAGATAQGAQNQLSQIGTAGGQQMQQTASAPTSYSTMQAGISGQAPATAPLQNFAQMESAGQARPPAPYSAQSASAQLSGTQLSPTGTLGTQGPGPAQPVTPQQAAQAQIPPGAPANYQSLSPAAQQMYLNYAEQGGWTPPNGTTPNQNYTQASIQAANQAGASNTAYGGGALQDKTLTSRMAPVAGYGTDVNGYSTLGDIDFSSPNSQALLNNANANAGSSGDMASMMANMQNGTLTPAQEAQWNQDASTINANNSNSPLSSILGLTGSGGWSGTPANWQQANASALAASPQSNVGGIEMGSNGMAVPLYNSLPSGQLDPNGAYTINGQAVNGMGQAITGPGAYNALSDYYQQSGETPETYNSTVANLLNQNPNLSAGMTPQQQMSLMSGQLGRGIPQSALPYFTQAGAPAPTSGASAPTGGAPSPTGAASPNMLPSGVSANFSPGSPTPSPVGTGATLQGSTGTTSSPSGPALFPTSGNMPGANPGNTGSNYSIPGALEAGAQGQGAGNQVQSASQQAALNLMNNPDPYNQQAVQNEYNWLSGNIQDQYTQAQQALGQQMAARGLGSSSIYGGQLGDLNIAQRSAQEALGENLAQNQAQSLGQYEQAAAGLGNQIGNTAQNEQQNYVAQLMGYGQNAFQNSLESQMANQQANQANQQYILGLLGLSYQNPYVG